MGSLQESSTFQITKNNHTLNVFDSFCMTESTGDPMDGPMVQSWLKYGHNLSTDHQNYLLAKCDNR